MSISETEDDSLHKSFNKAARWIFKEKKSKINPDDIDNKVVEQFMNEINQILQEGLNRGIEQSVPYSMKRNLKENVFVFSGGKTYAELKELSNLLLDNKGNIKPFSKFWQEVQAIYPQYNQSYLQAEYIFATQSAQMASKWVEYEKDGERYNLQYRTAMDDRVRPTHQVLHNTTLPPSDPFWDKYYPPNGWRCRCTVVQVRKSKYPESNSDEARLMAAEATSGQDVIFRFNPGKQKVIFPEHHPYLKKLSNSEKHKIVQKAKDNNEIITADDVVRVVNEVSKNKGWFERGFKKLEVTRERNVNGSTDMNGSIYLSRERFGRTISGINKLTKKESIDFNEADSLSTFWHEVTHNRNKKGNMFLTQFQSYYMEMANEFISRNTLPEFFEAFGSKVQFPELMIDRKKTGYNNWVVNYQNIISKTGLKKETVVEKVKNYLFNEPYDQQKTGLANALSGAVKKDGKTKLSKSDINSLLNACLEKEGDVFDKFLNDIIH